MYDILHKLLDRLEAQGAELGREAEKRIRAEQQVERTQVSASDVVALMEALATDRKIDAIKLHRQLTGYGLKESKDAVERVIGAIADRARIASAA